MPRVSAASVTMDGVEALVDGVEVLNFWPPLAATFLQPLVLLCHNRNPPTMATGMPIEHITPAVGQAIDYTEEPKIHQRVWGLEARGDSTVSFLEYEYWAKIERGYEVEAERKFRETQGPWSFQKMIGNRFSKGNHHEQPETRTVVPVDSLNEKNAVPVDPLNEKNAVRMADSGSNNSMNVTDEEWRTAARALRTASWGSIFFLVTTDILGWSSCPFVFASVGYGPGVAIYVVFGLAAGAAGFFLWKVFVTLDSARFPILSYGDLFLRVYGPKMRHFINVAQSFQQFCTVMILILGQGQIISQLAGPNLCFVACMIISMAVGMVLGSIRTLQRLSWLCNFSVWMNIASFIIM